MAWLCWTAEDRASRWWPRRATAWPCRRRHRVELQMQLSGQVEGTPLWALCLDHPLIPAEDGVPELPDDVCGLVRVVVAPDQDVPRAAVRRDGLRREEVDHRPLAAPAQPQCDRGAVSRCCAAPGVGLLAAEDREVIRVTKIYAEPRRSRCVAPIAVLPLSVHARERPAAGRHSRACCIVRKSCLSVGAFPTVPGWPSSAKAMGGPGHYGRQSHTECHRSPGERSPSRRYAWPRRTRGPL